MSKSKVRQIEAAAAERSRVEKEGVVVLHLRMADLFGKRDIIATKLNSPTDNIQGTSHMDMYTIYCPFFFLY